MTRSVLAATSIAAACIAPNAIAQQSPDAYPTGLYAGVVGQQLELTLTEGSYEAGEIDEDPTYGLRFGGRFNTGSHIVVHAELGVDVPQGTSDRFQTYCTPSDGCDATYSVRTESGVVWGANASVGVGYEVDHWLFSLSAGAEIAEVSRKDIYFRNMLVDSTWEDRDYAVGPRLAASIEYRLGDWSVRGSYIYRDLEYDRYESTQPGAPTFNDGNAVSGQAIEAGVFYAF